MPHSRACKLSPLAEADLEEIWLYTFHHWSLEQADFYLREVMDAMESLASKRTVGQVCDIRKGYWKYKVGTHMIYYRPSNHSLDIIRVLHSRMDVEHRI